MSSFKQKLDDEALAFFSEVASKKFSDQAVAFLNAYWHEVGSQADFIFDVAYEVMKMTDMHFQGCQYIHKYNEGTTNKLNAALYFYEKLCLKVEKDKKYSGDEYKISQPTMMTSIKRKKQLRDKVDVNFDGNISMLEYLLDQYSEFANPEEFCKRLMTAPDEHPEITAARLALEAVNDAIKAYETKKQKLTDLSLKGGVKGLRAKNQLAQLESGPLVETLNKALIMAEAALRKVTKKFKGKKGSSGDKVDDSRCDGAMWWMTRDLEEKKRLYGRRKK